MSCILAHICVKLESTPYNAQNGLSYVTLQKISIWLYLRFREHDRRNYPPSRVVTREVEK
jgi:hypothetical protein